MTGATTSTMPTTANPTAAEPAESNTGMEWWRTAVIYQIYPRSFADSNGDGIGDLAGITSRLPALRDLGIDAIWLSPFYTSPQHDAGYDVADYCDVDPLFGSLGDFDLLQRRAHELGLRVIVDLVPNHTSSDHQWFRDALAAGPGSAERAVYMFRDGKGAHGELPPNNWESIFGGNAWTRTTDPDGTPGQWYLHLFDTSQPDLDWENPWVREQFRGILRFWLDRGADGFRVDVAHGMVKAEGLPDFIPSETVGSMGGAESPLDPTIVAEPKQAPPYWAQDGVHEIYRDWHLVLAEYPGDRVLAAEAWVDPLSEMAKWVRPDEMHQAFNFPYLVTPWHGAALRTVIDASLSAFAAVGAPSTWVLSNHDVVRHASRLSLTGESLQGHGIGPKSVGLPDTARGLQRARAASCLMLALPGSSYLYQGEELGLPEAIDLPDEVREDPTWFRTNGERYGRDGCRVPLPWEADAPSYGFGPSTASWLPQPAEWVDLARDTQDGVADSTLEMYKLALRLRKSERLAVGNETSVSGGSDSIEWIADYGHDVVAFRNRDIVVVANTGTTAVRLPEGELLLSSGPVIDRILAADTTVWVRAEGRA